MTPRRVPWLLALALFVASQAALACPVCFAPKNEENRNAFVLMTGFLTFLPLGLIGGAVFLYRRRVKAVERSARAERRAARLRREGGSGPSSERGAALEVASGQLLKIPQGYFERRYASTPKAR